MQETRRFARLLWEGDILWKVGTGWIIWIVGELSKHVGGKMRLKPLLPMSGLWNIRRGQTLAEYGMNLSRVKGSMKNLEV